MKNLVDTHTRLYYVDWLRVIAMLGIFFFHNARFYDVFSDWEVKNATTSFGASIPIAFMNEWLMPFFFLIAGASTYYALKSRRPGQYIQERALRLLIPFIFGMFVIAPPQSYFEAISHGAQFGGYNFFQIYWLYLQTLPTLPWHLPWHHLWFLAYLFVFSMITLPIFMTWREGGTSITSKFALLSNKPWVIPALLILLLAAVDVVLYPDGFWGSRDQGNWSIVAYLLFFISGYLIFANAHIMEMVKKLTWILLGIAIVALASLVVVFLDVLVDREAYFGSAIFIASQFVQAVSTWCCLLTILGLGSRFLERNNGFLSYANEAVLPFYILHQTIIITIGFYVIQWNTGVGLKYLTISITSFIAIMLIYEFIVRRINAVRFLFGMRLRRRPRMALAIEGQT
jgi:glucan biosynthesis protein C